MAIFDNLFKSTRELENERRRAARQNERKVEQDLSGFDEQILALAKQRDTAWCEARELLKSGRKTEAQRQLLYYKRYDIQITKLENQKAFLTGQAVQIRSTGNAAATLADIRTMAAGQGIDPDALDENLSEMELITQDIADSDKQMSAAFDRDIDNMRKAEANGSIRYEDADLMSALENECAAEISGQPASVETSTQTNDASLTEGVERLKKLLGSK